ncbi:MAG: ATP-grasp domain-containing protein [Solobacterium sp.]|nr:ATP-grasp domain-containing protein [Solobacterium sp.]
MILGGAEAQVPIIQAAKKEGYYVIVCDWTTTNPGIKYADKHYPVNTMDRDAVTRIAVAEKIDGVISNSEPAMLNVSYIAEELHLRGNPVSGLEILLSKDRFRSLQEEAGVYAPKHYKVSNEEDFLKTAAGMQFPFVVKPVASSGSRGTAKVLSYDEEELKKIYRINSDYSRDNCCTIEEYVEMPSLTVIEGDLFVLNKEILWDGLFFNTRSTVTPNIPMTYSIPFRTDPEKMAVIKNTLTRLLDAADFTFGELNVEMYFTEDDRLFVIEINPRQGGAGIPAFIFRHCGVDMYRLLVTTAVKDDRYFHSLKQFDRECHYMIRHSVFAHSAGVYKGISCAPAIQKYVTNIEERIVHGDRVEAGENGTNVLAFVDLEFGSYELQHQYCEDIESYISPVIADE